MGLGALAIFLASFRWTVGNLGFIIACHEVLLHRVLVVVKPN